MKTWGIYSVALAVLAAVLTVLGGMVLAFDKSLWPIDGYVLYGGQLCHIVVCAYSAVAIVRGLQLRGSRSFSGFWFSITSGVFVLAMSLLALTWHTFFVYGIIPR
jgi:hypothetical protein